MDTNNEAPKRGRPSIINRETVSRALEDLTASDQPNPTYKQLHRHIGGGSMSTLVRVYRELQMDKPPTPKEKAFLVAAKKFFTETDQDLASWAEREIDVATENARTKVRVANEEREKFIHMRSLLNERAEKAEQTVCELRERQELHELEAQKYRSHIQALQDERELQAVEHATMTQQLSSQKELVESVSQDKNSWRQKYENEKLMREEDSIQSRNTLDQLRADLSNKAATEKSLVVANEEIRKNEASLAKQLTVLETQINNLLQQQLLQDEWKKDMLARIRERDDDIIRGKKQIDKLNAQLDVTSKEFQENKKRCETLKASLAEANNKNGITLHRLDTESTAHKETKEWCEKTIRYKNDEIDQLRKNLAQLIVSNKSSRS